jgi:hypothetical protein
MSQHPPQLLRKIGRNHAIGGLLWRPLPGMEDSEPRTEVKIEAKLQGARFGVMQERKNNRYQVAFLPLNAPAAGRRAYSAAIWLSWSVEAPTLYIEHLGKDRWWVVSVVPGIVDPRTDVVLDEKEAEERIDGQLQEMQSLEREAEIYIWGEKEPYSNMLPRFKRVRRAFEDLVGQTPPPDNGRLDQLVGIRPRTYGVLALLGVAAVIAYAGWLGYQAMLRQQELLAEQQRLQSARIAEQRMADLTELRIAEAVHMAINEDTQHPLPSAVVAGCLDVATQFGTTYGGWAVKKLDCSPAGDSVNVSIEQAAIGTMVHATHADLIARAAADGLNPAITIASQNGSISTPIPTPPPARAPLQVTDLITYRTMMAEVLPAFQRARAYAPTGTLIEVNEPTTRNITYINPAKEDVIGDPERIKPVPAERGYREGTIALRGTSLWLLNDLRIDLPFLRITSLSLTPKTDGYDFSLEATYVIASD